MKLWGSLVWDLRRGFNEDGGVSVRLMVLGHWGMWWLGGGVEAGGVSVWLKVKGHGHSKLSNVLNTVRW